MPDRDEFDRQWQANEAERNRLHAMSPAMVLAAYYRIDLGQFWPVPVALAIGLGLIWLARRRAVSARRGT
jgi:hypothetical protein